MKRYASIPLILGVMLLAYTQSGCGLAAQEIGHRLGKTIAAKTIPVVKTSYLCDLPTLTAIVRDETSAAIERSEIVMKFETITDETLKKKLEVRTLKGSTMTIDLKEEVIEEMTVAEVKIRIKEKEEGISVWKREDVSQRGPFLEIVKAIRDRVSENGIKIVSDTVSTPLL